MPSEKKEKKKEKKEKSEGKEKKEKSEGKEKKKKDSEKDKEKEKKKDSEKKEKSEGKEKKKEKKEKKEKEEGETKKPKEEGETKKADEKTSKPEAKEEAKASTPEVKEEDRWMKVKVGDPLPEHTLLLRGADNQYPAFWINTEGKVTAGRVFHKDGYINGMFADEGKALTGPALKGEIYILLYEGNFEKNKFWYDWVAFAQREEEHLTVVKRGTANVILIKNKNSVYFLGHWNGVSDKGTIGYGKEWEIHIGAHLEKAYILCRNNTPPPFNMDCNPADLRPKVVPKPKDIDRITGGFTDAEDANDGKSQTKEMNIHAGKDVTKPPPPPVEPPPPPPPPTPPPAEPAPTPPPPKPPAAKPKSSGAPIQIILSPHENLWYDTKAGLKAPPDMVMADNRELKGTGKNYVAIWYWSGKPTFGRAFENAEGVIEGSFARGGHEHTGKKIGHWQVLRYTDTSDLFFEYAWKLYSEAEKERETKSGWTVVKLADDIPIIIEDGNEEHLGRFDYTKGCASYGKNGQEVTIHDSRKIDKFKVLYRKDTKK